MIPREILVVAEPMAGELSDVTLEILAGAHELAYSVGWRVTCVILTDNGKPFQTLPLASDKTIVVQDPSLAGFNPAAYAAVLIHVVKDLSPRLLLLGNTGVGTDLAAHLSEGLGVPAVGGVVRMKAEGDRIQFTSRLYGGKLLARTESASGMAIALLLPGSYNRELGMVDRVPLVEVRAPPVPLETLPIRFQELIEPTLEDVDVRKVPILIGAGRGIQSKENMPAIEALAKALGGAVCATRPIVDQGWLSRTRQVGRSGMTVKPRLYLALGISGAPEHVEGMKDSELIIAVNKDPEAPIFDVAKYGATVDLLELVPALTQKIKAAKGEA